MPPLTQTQTGLRDALVAQLARVDSQQGAYPDPASKLTITIETQQARETVSTLNQLEALP